MNKVRFLFLAVLIAALVAGGWMWWVVAHPFRPTHRVTTGPESGPVQVSTGARYSVASLRRQDALVDRYGATRQPREGTVWVVATVDYDATAVSSDTYSCQILLWAGQDQWDPDYSYSPPEPQRSLCVRGTRGQVAAAFEVPRRYLDRVDGVGVNDPGAEIYDVVITVRPT